MYSFFSYVSSPKFLKLQLEPVIVKQLYLKLTKFKWANNCINDIPKIYKTNKIS